MAPGLALHPSRTARLTDPHGDEALLVEQARSGSTAALGELYARHGTAVYRLAYRLTASVPDAEDVLQDVFVGLPRALGSFDSARPLEPWLKRVAARTALMRLRARGRRREEGWEAVEALPSHPSSEAEPIVDRLEVRRALGEMPEAMRTVFLLREVEGYSHAEIAGLLEITSGASAVRLSRAWAFLRERVGER